MSEPWQPMETAPKDGREVILHFPALREVTVGSWMTPPGSTFVAHWCARNKWTPWDPDGWQPLPAPPPALAQEAPDV